MPTKEILQPQQGTLYSFLYLLASPFQQQTQGGLEACPLPFQRNVSKSDALRYHLHQQHIYLQTVPIVLVQTNVWKCEGQLTAYIFQNVGLGWAKHPQTYSLVGLQSFLVPVALPPLGHTSDIVFEIFLILHCFLFTLLLKVTNIELLARGVNLPSNHGNHHLDITYQPSNPMDICRVMFTKISTSIPIKMNHHQVSIGLLYSSPKTIFTPLGENPNNIQKNYRIKIFVFEIEKVKVH